GFGRSGVAAVAGAGTSTRVQHRATPWSSPGAGPVGPGHRGRRGRGPLVDLAADLLITLPDAVVRVVGEVVELAVPLDTDLPGVLGTLAGGRAAGIGI